MTKKIAPYQVVRKEIDDSHFYWIDDEFVPGVTTILGDAGPIGNGLRKFWQKNTEAESRKILNDSAEFGSMIHGAIERLLWGEEIKLADYTGNGYKNAAKHLMAFHDWFHEFNPDIKSIKPEFVCGSKKYKYGGTLDLFCVKDKETWVIDFKTSNSLHSNHERQIAAYKQAYEEMTGEKVDKIGILRTGSQHKVGYEFREVDRPFESFLNVYRTYLDEHGGKMPEPPVVDSYPDTLRIIEK